MSEQLSLFDAPAGRAVDVGDEAVDFLLALEAEMRAVDRSDRKGRAVEELFWALVRNLQAEHTLTLVEASDAYLDGRRYELSETVASKSDDVLYGWLNPTPSVVNTVWQLAEGTALLRLDAVGAPYSSSRCSQIVACEDPDGSWAWRPVPAWWQPAIRRWPARPAVHPTGQWVAWCDRLPAGAPRGTYVLPARDGPVDYNAAVRPLADWWRRAAQTGRRWVCPHGWTHHPRRNPGDPLSCHNVRDADPCDRCCITAAPYRRGAA